MSRSEMPFAILRLLDEGSITIVDLADFSDEMKEYAQFHLENRAAWNSSTEDGDT